MLGAIPTHHLADHWKTYHCFPFRAICNYFISLLFLSGGPSVIGMFAALLARTPVVANIKAVRTFFTGGTPRATYYVAYLRYTTEIQD